MTPFSIDECAWSEQYTRRRGTSARPARPQRAHLRHGRLARRGDGMEAGDGSRVVDDAFERVRQADEAAQPAHHHRLQFGGGWRRAPEHGLLVQCGGDEVGEDSGGAGRNREVRHESRVVPVRHARHQDAVEVGDDGFEILGRVGRRVGQRVPDVARRHSREHGKPLGVLHEAGDPLDHGVAVLAELVGGHVAVAAAGLDVCHRPTSLSLRWIVRCGGPAGGRSRARSRSQKQEASSCRGTEAAMTSLLSISDIDSLSPSGFWLPSYFNSFSFNHHCHRLAQADGQRRARGEHRRVPPAGHHCRRPAGCTNRPADGRAFAAAEDGPQDGAAHGRAAHLGRAFIAGRLAFAVDRLGVDRHPGVVGQDERVEAHADARGGLHLAAALDLDHRPEHPRTGRNDDL